MFSVSAVRFGVAAGRASAPSSVLSVYRLYIQYSTYIFDITAAYYDLRDGSSTAGRGPLRLVSVTIKVLYKEFLKAVIRLYNFIFSLR